MAEDGGGRARDLAVIVPLVGTVLLLPPLVGLLARPDGAGSGLPLVALYLFGTWFALIVSAFALAMRLRGSKGSGDG